MTKLKYTQTILGPSRTGVLGMSVVGGRRCNDAKRLSSQTLVEYPQTMGTG